MPKRMLWAIKSCGDCWLCDRTAQWICFRRSTAVELLRSINAQCTRQTCPKLYCGCPSESAKGDILPRFSMLDKSVKKLGSDYRARLAGELVHAVFFWRVPALFGNQYLESIAMRRRTHCGLIFACLRGVR